MKVKKQYLVLVLVFLFLLVGTTISYGAFSASSSTVESGGQITVQVTSSEAVDAYNVDLESYDGLTFNSCSKTETGAIITINGSSIGYINALGKTTDLGTYKFTAPAVTEDKEYTITFKIDKSTPVTAKVTVKAPAQTTPDTNTGTTGNTSNNTQTDTPTTTTPVEPTKSSEARLKNFGIRPNDFTGFKRDKLEYSVEVPNDVAEVEIYGEKLDSKATVEGFGKVSLKEGNNTFEVKVTAEDGKTTKTYKLTIKRKTAEEDAEEISEARLSNLGIKPEEYDFSGFEKDKTEYTAEVPNEVEEIEVYAKAVDSKAQITGTGMIELKEGENTINVEVIAQNGTKKTYTLKVTRKAAETTEEPDETVEDEEKFGLSTLTVAGLTLNKKFDVGTYEYTIELTEDLTTLPITAKSTDKEASIEIIGNENLQPGENIITILVQNGETEEVATYQIIVNKNVAEEETIRASWLKPSTWGKEEIIKIAMVVVIIILIIIAVILKIQIAKDNKKEKKVDFPGADALDKALAEHQELATDEADQINQMQEGELAANELNGADEVNAVNEVNQEQQEVFAVSEATKGEVQKFLQEFPQGEAEEESQEINGNTETYEEPRVSVDDLFNNDDLRGRPRRRRGKHF